MEAGSILAPAAIPAIEKRQYRNNTLGWLGVVVLDPQGKPTGISVAPQGTVWLSDAEAILTARAPAQPKDNPFEEQVFYEVDQAGQQQERRVRPLVPITESRWVPQEDRYLPDVITGAQAAGIASANATADTPAHATKAGDPVAEASAAVLDDADPLSFPTETGPTTPIPGNGLEVSPIAQPAQVLPQTGTGGPTQSAPPAPAVPPQVPAEGDPSWTERPTQDPVVAGQLGGEDATPEQAAADAANPPPPPVATADPAPAPAAAEPTTEEVAVQATPGQEETGAALPPTGDPVEGEFAVNEEPGDPDAAAQAPPPAEAG